MYKDVRRKKAPPKTPTKAQTMKLYCMLQKRHWDEQSFLAWIALEIWGVKKADISQGITPSSSLGLNSADLEKHKTKQIGTSLIPVCANPDPDVYHCCLASVWSGNLMFLYPSTASSHKCRKYHNQCL